MEAKSGLEFMQWAIATCAPVITATAVYAASCFKELKISVHELNLKMAVVVEKVGAHEERFDRQDKRIDRLEERV